MKQLFTLLSFLFLTSLAVAAPTITPVQTYTPVCNSGNTTTFYKIAVTGIGSPYIAGVNSSNISVIDGANVNYSTTYVGNVTYFEFYGIPLTEGTFFLTVDVSDGYGNELFNGSPIEVIASNPPSFISEPVTLCSSQGFVDLNEYVTIPGYDFVSTSLEVYFDNGIVNTDESPFTFGEEVNISYNANVGNCMYHVQGSIVLYESANVDMSVESTACNTLEGSAELFVGGGDTPFTIIWTTGQQNVTGVSGLGAGAYAVEVTTAHGCSQTVPFIVENTDVSVGVETTDVSCHGGDDGAIELFPSGLTQPLNIIWSSGHSTQNISGLSAGYYTVNIRDAANCVVVQNVEVYQPDLMQMETSINLPVCGEQNGDVSVTEEWGGVPPFTYEWNNGSTENYIEDIGYGIYSVTATDQNGCIQVQTYYVSESGGADLYGTVTPSNCGTPDGSIITQAYPPFGAAVDSVLWSTGAITPDVFNLAPDNYICTVTTNTGCHTIKGWDIPAAKPLQNNICVVTVDDLTTTNLVVWEKVQTEGIGYYKIYRETSQNGFFALIDTVNASSESIFNDVVASPLERSWKYKISAVNTCDEEGPMSLPHQTIHLDVLPDGTDAVTVSWNAYTGTAFTNYYVSRYTDLNGWEELDVLPSTQLSYSDDMPITTPGLDYVVEMELSVPCVADKAQDFNSSRSNKDKAQFNPGSGTGDSNNDLGEDYLNEITVYPNPATDKLFIGQEQHAKLEITILTLEGQQVQNEVVATQMDAIDISKLAPGVYIVNISLNGTVKNLRVIKL